MDFDVASHILSYYEAARPDGKNRYPRLKAWEFLWEYVWYENENWEDLIAKDNLDKTALHIGFYLANWGMFRGSSGLLDSNLDIFRDISRLLFSGSGRELFELTLRDFSVDSPNLLRNQALLDSTAQSFRSLDSNVTWTHTLISKILLGVWGQYPALDRFYLAGSRKVFGQGMHLTEVSGRGLTAIVTALKLIEYDLPSLTTSKYQLNYPEGRLIDMALFNYGRMISSTDPAKSEDSDQ